MKKRIILFIIGIILTLLVVNIFGFFGVVNALLSANPLYIALAVGLQFLTLAMLAARQRLIGGPYVPFSKTFRVVMSGNFVNLVVPGPAVGGEPLKIYMLRSSYGTSKATAVIAVDDFVEIFGTLLVVLFAVLFFAPTVAPQLTAILVAFVIIVMLFMAGIMKLLLTPRWLKRVVNWFVDRISKYQNIEKKDYARMFYNAFRMLLEDKRMLAGALLITITIKVIEFAIIMLSFAAIGVSLPWREIVVLWSAIVVFLFIPWLPGSLGLVEFGAASTLVVLGLTSSAAASGIVITRFISFWFVLLVGMAIIYHAKNLGELPKGIGLENLHKKTFKD